MEIDPASASLARANVDANGLAERVTVVEGDALRPSSVTPTADLVLTNPPYLSAGRARISSAKTGAHEMPPGQLDLWAKAALRLLSGRGRLVLVHRAEVLPELLQVLCGRFGALAVRPVLPRADQQAIRILVFGTKGSRGPFRILPPLVLHEPDGTFTPLAAAIHRGEARLSWN
jgi:tRNA1(Val) A37 N6-methylase TrmN6